MDDGRVTRETTAERTEAPQDRRERRGDAALEEGYRFDDPYWDEAFGTYYDSAMRVCSVYGC